MRYFLFLWMIAFFPNAGLHAQTDKNIYGKLNRSSQKAIQDPGFNPDLQPFYHGVASGDPSSESVIIWTRITPDAGQSTISGTYYVAADTSFSNIIQSGNFSCSEAQDFTVHIEVTNLAPGQVYYYFFRALGANSLIGRARTCPIGPVNPLKFAVVSCSNYEGGFFNAYEMIAQRNDLDAVIHLGDYIYEYGAGTYGIPLPNRINDPGYEILNLADYRTRYSLYRMDKDLIRLHQQHTMISIWDDHESANDAYQDGAQNHQANEGDWATRKAISKKVYFEWMPMRSNGADTTVYRRFSYGNLCDLLMLDTRLEGRVQPPQHFDSPDTPPRDMISPTQYNWLHTQIKNSTARWVLIGNQVLFSTTNVGFAGGPFDGAPDPFNIDSIRISEDLFIDNWESYPTQRNAIIDSLILHDQDNVVLITGDSHCSWAFDVTQEPVLYPLPQFLNLPQPNPYNPSTKKGYDPLTGAGSWAVELGAPSVSSPNFDEIVGPTLAQQFSNLINQPLPVLGNYNPHLKYAELLKHGYILLTLQQDTLQGDFYYVPTVQQDTFGEAFGKAAYTLAGSRRVQVGVQAAAAKITQDIPTPLNPPALFTNQKNPASEAIIFSVYPNPARDWIMLQIGLPKDLDCNVVLYSLAGEVQNMPVSTQHWSGGIYHCMVPLEGLSSGQYVISLKSDAKTLASRQFLVIK